MQAGEPLRECAVCAREEALGLTSKRQHELGRWGEIDGEPAVRSADVKLGHACNLQCWMCDPNSSSSLAREFRALGWDRDPPFPAGQMGIPVVAVYRADFAWPNRSEVWRLLTSQLTELRRIKFTGGEPFLNPHLADYLVAAQRLGLHALQIQVTTNATWIPGRLIERAVGVSWLLLKAYAYDGTFPEPGCVRQNDFDVLVRPGDLFPATAALERMGYRRVPRPWPDEYRYQRTGATTIDLHVSYNPHCGPWANAGDEVERAFARATSVPLGDWHLPVLLPLDNAAFLLVHTALHHNFTPLAKVVACWNSLIRWQHELDPRSLQETLRLSGVGRLGGLTVAYLERLVGCRLWTGRGDETSPWWERLALACCLPRPDAYLAAAAQRRLNRRRRDGLHLCLYPDTWRHKMLCLQDVWRVRRKKTD